MARPSNPHKINWSYVAGFFDGEGSVHSRLRDQHGLRVGVVMAQKNNGTSVLLKIKKFCLSEGVHLNLYPVRSLENGQALASHKHETVDRFLKKVYPFLIVKKPAAKRALLAIRIRRWQKTATLKQRKDAALFYLSGRSLESVKAKFKISQEALHKGLSEIGSRMRTRSESAFLAWSSGRRAA